MGSAGGKARGIADGAAWLFRSWFVGWVGGWLGGWVGAWVRGDKPPGKCFKSQHDLRFLCGAAAPWRWRSCSTQAPADNELAIVDSEICRFHACGWTWRCFDAASKLALALAPAMPLHCGSRESWTPGRPVDAIMPVDGQLSSPMSSGWPPKTRGGYLPARVARQGVTTHGLARAWSFAPATPRVGFPGP